jgi:hypothetical protein
MSIAAHIRTYSFLSGCVDIKKYDYEGFFGKGNVVEYYGCSGISKNE